MCVQEIAGACFSVLPLAMVGGVCFCRGLTETVSFIAPINPKGILPLSSAGILGSMFLFKSLTNLSQFLCILEGRAGFLLSLGRGLVRSKCLILILKDWSLSFYAHFGNSKSRKEATFCDNLRRVAILQFAAILYESGVYVDNSFFIPSDSLFLLPHLKQ